MKTLNYIFAVGAAKAMSVSHVAIHRRAASSLRSVLRWVFAATLTGIVSFSGAASAAFVSQWKFIVDSGFTAFSPVPGVTGSNNNVFLSNLGGPIPVLGGGAAGPFPGGVPSLLTWGASAGFGPSSLSANSATNGMVMGTANTNGGPANSTLMTHLNNPVFAPFLTSATLTNVLRLQPMVPPDITVIQAPALQFDIIFTETLNEEPCASLGGPPCNDIFTVTAPGFDPSDNSFNQPFSFMGQDYVGKLQITGLAPLTDAECAAAGVANGCIGFVTQENNANNFQAQLSVAAVPIPPAGILFFTALAGLGIAARRRKMKGAI